MGTTTIRSWGGLRAEAQERRHENLEAVTAGAALTVGLGRSYGDAGLPVAGDAIVNSCMADRVLEFDLQTGSLRAEAGLSLRALNRITLPHRWAIPVSPGTEFVTLGGMIAADVHGKNHHVDGTIGRWVQSLRMRMADGDVVECSRERLPDLFRATLGGMGLTGHILDARLQLRPLPSPWVHTEAVRLGNLEELLQELRDSSAAWPYTAAWVDALASGRRFGRGVVMRGRWARPDEAPATPPPLPRQVTVPLTAPNWALSRPTLRAFNTAFFHRHPRRPRPRTTPPWGFFYPLDAVHQWQRLYGPRGFIQHQCVLPREAGLEAVAGLLRRFAQLGGQSFLSVVKDCGEQGEGVLSFPRPGISIALDIPLGGNTQELVDGLNRLIIEAGGRIYLAKDAFTRPADYAAMDPRVHEFLRLRRQFDPHGRLRSAMSVRLFDPLQRSAESAT